MRGIWKRLKDWRTNVPSKRGLDVVEIFYRLNTRQRVLLVILSIAVYSLTMSGVFSANVVPHYKAILNADGSINSGELTAALALTASVLCLSAIPLFWKAKWLPLGSKILMGVTGLFILFGTVTNAIGTQTRAREARNDPVLQKKERIGRLDARIAGLNTTWHEIEKHDATSDKAVEAAEKAAEEARKSAYDECHTGAPVIERRSKQKKRAAPPILDTALHRGPKCGALEEKRDAQLKEVGRLQHDKDLTDRASAIEAELTELRKQRATEGAAPEHVDAEMESFSAFVGDMGFPQTGAALSKHKSMLDVIMMELTACTFATPFVMAVFWLFSLFTSRRSEADRRMVEIAKEVADERAKIVLAAVPQSPIASAVMEPDQSEEAVLEIEGQELPAFANAPETVAEAHAAAVLKADPDRSKGRKARNKKKPSRDSVRLWVKEDTVHVKAAMCGQMMPTPTTRDGVQIATSRRFRRRHLGVS